MLREVIETGATVEEALQLACEALGIARADAQFEILQMPAKKTLGIFGGSLAKVRVFIEESPITIAQQYLKQILSDAQVNDAEITTQESEGSITINIMGDSVSFLIGHHGETLDALQYLVGLAANRKGGEYCRISLNIGNYREKREKTLSEMAKRSARQVLRSGRNYHFEPMNSYERRIIHTAIQEIQGVTSWSVGETSRRHVVVGTTSKPTSPYRRKTNTREKHTNTTNNDRVYSKITQSKPVEKPVESPSPTETDGSFDLFASLDKKPRKMLDAPVANTSGPSLRPPDRLKSDSTPLYGRIDLDK